MEPSTRSLTGELQPANDARLGPRVSSRRIVAGIAVAVLILAYFGYRWHTSGFDWVQFATTFTGVHWAWLTLSLIAVLATYVGRALRWTVMLKPLKPDPSFWRVLEATCIGFTAIVFFGRAGELVRPFLIASKEKVPFTSQVAAWVLERVLDLLMVVLIFSLALSRISHSRGHVGPGMRWVIESGGLIIGLAGFGCIALIFLFRHMSDSMYRRLSDALRFLPQSTHQRLDPLLKAFMEGMGSTRSFGFIVSLLAYSLLEWTVITAAFVFQFRAFPVTANFSFTDVVITLGVVAVGSAIQIPGIGGGMQVSSILVLTEFFGIPLAASTGIAIAIWGISFLAIVPVGVVLALKEGLNLRRLARMSGDEPARGAA